MNILKRPNRKGDKITFYYDYGRCKGQRPSTGIFVYTRPKNQAEKNHNKQAKDLLDVKKSQLIIEQQAIGSGFIPGHKFKANFLDYFEEYVKLNKREGNRHLTNSLIQFVALVFSNNPAIAKTQANPFKSIGKESEVIDISKGNM
jgi:hypothetical protein